MVAVFNKAFFDARRGLVWLSVGLALYVLMVMPFYPTMVSQSEQMDEMVKSMPKQFVGLFYSGNLDDFSIADPGLFLQGRFMLWTILILGVTASGQAFGAFINAERSGTFDVMMSFPISRRAYFLGRVAYTVVSVLVVLSVSFVMLAAFSLFMKEFTLTIGELAEAVFAAFFPVMVLAGFAYMVGAVVPSSKNFAGPLVYCFIFGAYILHSFSVTIDELEPIRSLFLYDYYDAGVITRDGLDVTRMLILSVVALTYFGIGYWYIDKKELGV